MTNHISDKGLVIFATTPPRARVAKEKINKWDYIKLQSPCTAKDTINKMKREFTVRENIFANEVPDKGLKSKKYKEPYNSSPGR